MELPDVFRRLAIDRSGATAIEYALIVTLIFVVILGAVNLVASDVTNLFNTISGNVSASS
ncbi:MAG: Flp family type IVb pilin [Rhodospirillales bacterium]